MEKQTHNTYSKRIWQQFCHHPMALPALVVVTIFCLVGIYAPLLASSQPLYVIWNDTWYFPLLKYLFYQGFFTKKLDLFFNSLMFTTPLFILAVIFLCHHKKSLIITLTTIVIGQICLFLFLALQAPSDPATDPLLNRERQNAVTGEKHLNWNFQLQYLNDYGKLEMVLQYRLLKEEHKRLERYAAEYRKRFNRDTPTLWQQRADHEAQQITLLEKTLERTPPESPEHKHAKATLLFLKERNQWFEKENDEITFIVMPLLRHHHWQDDAGGEQSLNQVVPWFELTRINRKDLIAGLIFGVRISLVVGIMAVSLALMIGIPIGALAGFYGGKFDIIVSRILEIWEAMPVFFMLLLIVAITESKSIFIIITVIGAFGWTGFSRYIRGEFFKQRNLPYVEACKALGFSDKYTIFVHILPNAIPPLLTLLPFAIMGAITSEAGLSFLGLGEEGSCSWGVLMDEGRSAFPGESYLLWPPAILLTTLLIAIALVGDALRDALDPKLHRAH